MPNWNLIKRYANQKCPKCGREMKEAPRLEADTLYRWEFHENCLNPILKRYEVEKTRILGLGKDLPELPDFTTLPNFYEAKQEQKEAKFVPIAKIVGSEKEACKNYYEGWIPKDKEFDARFERIFKSAFIIKSCGGNPAQFLEEIPAHKHVFYFPSLDQYYVCNDGNRRTATAHLLGLKQLKYDLDYVYL